MTLKEVIVCLATRVHDTPISRLLSIYYRMALQVCVRRLSKIPGAKAIYMSGSMARGEAIFGLSDVDLVIFLNGRDNPVQKRKIQGIFTSLKLIFPILGSIEEKGVFYLGSFSHHCDRYPLLKHLFDPSYFKHRLIWGEDVLPKLDIHFHDDYESALALVWRYRYWIEKLVLFLEGRRLTNQQKYHLLYKAVRNAFEIWLRLTGVEHLAPSDEKVLMAAQGALGKTGQGFTHDEIFLLQKLIDFRKSLYRSHSGLDFESLFNLFKKIMMRCLDLIGIRVPRDRPLVKCTIIQTTPSAENVAWIERLTSICGPHTKICVGPSLRIPVSALDAGDFDATVYRIETKGSIGLETIQALRSFYLQEMKGNARIEIWESAQCVYAAHGELLEHWLSSHLDGEHVFRASVSPRFVEFLKNRIVNQLSEIKHIVASGAICHMADGTYWDFFFSALQRMALLFSVQNGRFDFYTGPRDIALFLHQHTPLEKDFIDMLGEPPSDHTNLNREKATALINMLAAILSGDLAFDKLEELNTLQDRKRLAITVIVVTRNRAQMLNTCLRSLSRQNRRPDEVIVVDNGSTDNTQAIVEQYPQLSITYLYEASPGISRARNVGVKAARGDVIAFIDDDAMAQIDWLAAIEKAFLKDPGIGIVGGAIHNLREANRNDWVYRYHQLQEEHLKC